jgi:hypothetical protein
MKKIVMALAVIMLAGLFWPNQAEARCWWNGYRWHCTHYRHYWSGHYYPYRYYRPYYYGYGYYPYYYRPVCTPWPLCWG